MPQIRQPLRRESLRYTMEYEYRVVPFIGFTKGKLSPGGVAAQLESEINRGSEGNWEFYQLKDVNIEVSPGCLGSLLGAKTQYIRYDQIIFRRSLEFRGSDFEADSSSRFVEHHEAEIVPETVKESNLHEQVRGSSGSESAPPRGQVGYKPRSWGRKHGYRRKARPN